MSRQQYSQRTDNFGDSQNNPTQSSQNQQPHNLPTMPGDLGAAPATPRYEPAVRSGDNWNDNVAPHQGLGHQRDARTGPAGPTDVYTGHGGQLGTTGQGDQYGTTAGIAGTDRRSDVPGQNAQTYGATPGLVPPPAAVPQPRVRTVQPSTSDKLMGNVEKLAGKVSGNEQLVERGQARKTGTLNSDQF
ncbi:hypothetical protein LXA43DRAFT_1127173 [Ganoderma leucocontextum]|nr:hypothetical protein LXA43DRAFT_1127173 [Ganoderma leucocontextum]